MIASEGRLREVLGLVFGREAAPRPFDLLQAAWAASSGRLDFEDAVRSARTTRKRLSGVLESTNPVTAVLGQELPVLTDDMEARVRASLGQLLIGALAEQVFEEIYKRTLGTDELELRDDRGTRGETDYLVFNGQGRQVFRINIKFHGSLFRRARELVGVDPEDCFALATYKIHAALNRQDSEHLPYLFVIVGVPGLTGSEVGSLVPRDLVHLTALPRELGSGNVRRMEDKVVEALVQRPNDFGFTNSEAQYLDALRRANWYVLSARRADALLREKLFDRAYALRVRGFAAHYRNAELDMHFSLSQDLLPLTDFLEIVRVHGMTGLVSRLERGTV